MFSSTRHLCLYQLAMFRFRINLFWTHRSGRFVLQIDTCPSVYLSVCLSACLEFFWKTDRLTFLTFNIKLASYKYKKGTKSDFREKLLGQVWAHLDPRSKWVFRQFSEVSIIFFNFAYYN